MFRVLVNGKLSNPHESECLLLIIDGQFSFSFLDPRFRACNLSYFLLHPRRTTTARKMTLCTQSSETNTNSKANGSSALPGLTQSSGYQPRSVVSTFSVKALVTHPPGSLYLGLGFYDVSPPCLVLRSTILTTQPVVHDFELSVPHHVTAIIPFNSNLKLSMLRTVCFNLIVPNMICALI